jgi:hypothetical protein
LPFGHPDAKKGNSYTIKLTKENDMNTQSRDSKDQEKPDLLWNMFLKPTPQQPKTIEIPMPLSPTEWVKVQASYPLSEKAWEQMQNILKAYKPSLVPEIKPEDAKKEN